MKRLRFVVSLTNNDNDYQIEQAKSAEEAARRLGVDTQIIYSGNDSVTQSTQLLNVVQAAPQLRPDAIVFEPVGATALPQVARASVAANVGWVVLNREANYISDLRRQFKVPIFCVSNDHTEIGRIQGLLDSIDPREAEVLRLRFGLDERAPLTLREIGRKLGISRERVRQIESRALQKLHERFSGGPSAS